MRNPQGYVTIVEPGQQTKEIDTFTCGHCNTIVHVNLLQNLRMWVVCVRFATS